MTPYELRFEILKHATSLAQEQYNKEYGRIYNMRANITGVGNRNGYIADDLPKFPEYPTYDDIQAIASAMDEFVSKDKARYFGIC